MTRLVFVRLLAVVVLGGAGCSDNPMSTGGDGGADLGPAAIVPEIACTDTIDSIYADPGTLPDKNGTIIRCAKDQDLTAAQINTALQNAAQLDATTFTARPVTSGAHVYRILYKTERGTAPRTAGVSSALVYLPDSPIADKVPALVASHGSRGQAPDCTPSKRMEDVGDTNPDLDGLTLSMAGYGYALVAPDLAGYANFGASGNPAPMYASAEDVTPSTLDGARALQQMIPSALNGQVALWGHSQGGHSALSAMAQWESYAPELNITAVVVAAPLWLSQRTWGALMAVPTLFPTSGSPATNAASVWYHYTHAEALDGPGAGMALFNASKRTMAKAFVDSTCWGYPDWSALKGLGADASEIYDQQFIDAVGNFAVGFAADCPTDATLNPICERWKARYAADRPHLTGKATQVPLQVMWGAGDIYFPPDRITCALDRLQQDHAALESVCVDPQSDHVGILFKKVDFAADWLASKTLGRPAPAPCAADATAIKDEMGMPAVCAVAPPNDD